jgi:hypothetical protein
VTKKKRKSNPFLVCPYECGGRKYKSVNKGRTRCCDREIVRVNGGIYEHLDAAPEWVLLQLFVEHKQKTDPGYTIEYASRQYQTDVGSAHFLYKECDLDLDLAKKVIEITFTHRDHRWRNMPGFWAVISKKLFPDAKAKARIALHKQKKADDEQRARVIGTDRRLMEMAYADARL